MSRRQLIRPCPGRRRAGSVIAGAVLSAMVVAAASLGMAAVPASAADSRSQAAAERAVAFIAAQQNADGGFGDAPDTETPDAVLAIAEAAQTTLVYDAGAARRAVDAVRRGANSALHYLDDLSARPALSAGKAAEIVLAARAVGLDPAAFDPDGDGAVDLAARIAAALQPDGTYGGTFYFTLQAALVQPLLGRAVTPATLAYLRGAQRLDGGYNFNGDQAVGAFDASDTDITALAVQALVAAGLSAADPSVRAGVAFLATQHNPDGGFRPSFAPGSNPGSTRGAVLAIVAAGYAVEQPCWRALATPAVTTSYRSPDEYLRSQQDGTGRFGEDTGFAATQYTAQSVQALLRNFQPVVRASRQPCPTTGYRLVAADGGVFAFGAATYAGSTGGLVLNRPVVAAAATPSGAGYWLFASDGGVFTFGDAAFLGSTGGLTLNRPVVAAAATPSGGGYWLFASDGGVFSFGDAAFLGSAGALSLNQPIVAADATPSGRGYRLFAADGGVFVFGDASFEGSKGGVTLNKPIVGAATSRVGRGYWLFAADGGVFAFGDAAFSGSTGDVTLNRPIVGAARTRGDGYHLVASDGGVFAFGDAPFLGSTGGVPLSAPVVALIP